MVSYDMELKTGFFKTCKCSLDLTNDCIQFHPKKLTDDADIFVPFNSIYEVGFLRVNDKLVEIIVSSSEKSYVGRISDIRQALAIADQMKDEFGLKVYLE